MLISISNNTQGLILDEELQKVIRSLNRQIKEDFKPYWNYEATIRLEGNSSQSIDRSTNVDMRGDAVIYLWDETDVQGALGYHDRNYRGIPYGFVFVDVCDQLGENWTVTLSHEVLELVGDRNANLLVAGPHPKKSGKRVCHWREMCDAVQTETYFIDEVEVSNFVLPLYFTEGQELGSRNDFLGRLYNGESLQSFGVNPGGYLGYYDPEEKNMIPIRAKEKVFRRR